MKIVFEILSMNVSGGAERVLASLSSELAKRGHEVIIICLEREGKGSYFPLNEKVKVEYLKNWDDPLWVEDYFKDSRILYRIWLMKKALKKLSPDISVSFLTDMTIYAAWAAKQLGIPHISCERNSPWDKPEKEDKRKRRDRAFSISAGAIVQTHANKSYFDLSVQKKITVISNPIILECKPMRCEDCDKRIVAVGRLTSQKNYEMLIKGFAAFHLVNPEFTLEIYGQDFGEKSMMKKLIERENLRKAVFIFDPISNLHEKIRNAAVFVMTSNYEGFPNALAEALALGIPCIATDCRSKGPACILDNGKRGILIPVGNVTALINSLNYLVSSSDLAKKYSLLGIKYGAQNSIETYTNIWEKYLRRVVDVNAR